MQSSSEQPLVMEEHCVTTLITAAKETSSKYAVDNLKGERERERIRRVQLVECYDSLLTTFVVSISISLFAIG